MQEYFLAYTSKTLGLISSAASQDKQLKLDSFFMQNIHFVTDTGPHLLMMAKAYSTYKNPRLLWRSLLFCFLLPFCMKRYHSTQSDVKSTDLFYIMWPEMLNLVHLYLV